MGIFDWKHWLVILLVVVIVFGTKRLKHLGSDVGEAIKGFRKAVKEGDEEADEPAAGAKPEGRVIEGEAATKQNDKINN